MTRTVAALYDSRDEAERVRSRLVSALSVKSPPRIIGKDTVGAIDGMKFAPKDAQSYRDGLRSGAYLLVAQVPGTSSAKQIVELLEVPDIDRSDVSIDPPGAAGVGRGVEVSIPDEGQARQSRAAPPAPEPSQRTIIQAQPQPQAQPLQPPHRQPQAQARTQPQAQARTQPQQDQIPARPRADVARAMPETAAEARQTPTPLVSEEARIPLVEEELRVGKREVTRGGARVRAFTRDEPAEEQVTLQDELIEVDSRPSERRLSDSEIEAGGLFKDRVFEIAEMREEPVVTKISVVREEVIVRKRIQERVETIRDTVRHTEVEVEDLSDSAPREQPPGPRFRT
jgi:stress response protein YsnF